MSTPSLETVIKNARSLAKPGEKLMILKRVVFTKPAFVIRAYDPRYIHDEQYIATVEK
jgi:hypothetical protein